MVLEIEERAYAQVVFGGGVRHGGDVRWLEKVRVRVVVEIYSGFSNKGKGLTSGIAVIEKS